jgi:Arc/MetJ-type ribon-helix-helix transcriptional regulator
LFFTTLIVENSDKIVNGLHNDKGRFAKGHKKIGGKKKGYKGLSASLHEQLENKIKDGIATGEYINMALIQKALRGDLRAIDMIYDREEGKAAQNINLGGQEDNPVKVQFEYIDPKDEE